MSTISKASLAMLANRNCPYCNIAEKFLQASGLPYTVTMLDTFIHDEMSDLDKSRFIQKITKTGITVPYVIMIKGSNITPLDMSPFIKNYMREH